MCDNWDMVSSRWAERERIKQWVLGYLAASPDAALADALHWIQDKISVGPDGCIPWMDDHTWCIMDSITRAARERFDRVPENPSDIASEELAVATHFALRTQYPQHADNVKQWVLVRARQLTEKLDAEILQLDAMMR